MSTKRTKKQPNKETTPTSASKTLVYKPIPVRERPKHIPVVERMKSYDIDTSIPNKYKPYKYNDPIALANRIDEYFKEAEEKHLPVTMSGLAVYLDISRVTLVNYEKTYPDCKELFSAIKRARNKVEASFEGKLVSGMPATGLIFGLKNNFGWKDNLQLDVLVNNDSVFNKEAILNASKELLLELGDGVNSSLNDHSDNNDSK